MTRTMILTLEAQQPAVFSAKAATLGAHTSLDAPTGANFLGWAASQCYAGMESALHSGTLRFSNAVRMVEGVGAFPNPSILLAPKHEGGEACLGRAAFSKTHPDKQAEAVKGRLVTQNGIAAPKPNRERRLRTAMTDGVSDKGKLFGYQSVLPGSTRFQATVELNEGSVDLWGALKVVFDGQTLHLGRGAASGFGGAYKCSVSESDKIDAQQSFTGNRIRLWLLSDVQLVDAFGAPKLEPEAEDFGLLREGWTLIRSESNATTRRIWPWNGTYKSRDMEMAVIEAGSVFTFVRNERTDEQLPFLIGIGQERGFGRFSVLADDQKFTLDAKLDQRPKLDVSALDTKLMRFATARKERNQGYANTDWTDRQIAKIIALLARLNGEGPGPSQWSRLGELVSKFLAKDEDFGSELEKLLSDAQWKVGYGDLERWVKQDLFEKGLTPPPNAADFARIIRRARAAAQGGGQ